MTPVQFSTLVMQKFHLAIALLLEKTRSHRSGALLERVSRVPGTRGV